MNILDQKLEHPTKGLLPIGRWNKTDLANIILTQNRIIQQQQAHMYWYRLLYGFNVG